MKKLEFLHVVLRCTAATVSAGSILRSAGRQALTRIPTPYCVYLIDTGKEGRARGSRPPQLHPPVDLFLTGGRDESQPRVARGTGRAGGGGRAGGWAGEG